MKKMKLFLSLLFVMALTAATALTLGSCDKNGGDDNATTQPREEAITITVTVTDDKGIDTVFTIETKAWYLRDALEQENLVEGEESEHGLYIKVVNGLRADFDLDKAYWSLLKGGEYLMTGVDTTLIADGDAFELVYTKG